MRAEAFGGGGYSGLSTVTSPHTARVLCWLPSLWASRCLLASCPPATLVGSAKEGLVAATADAFRFLCEHPRLSDGFHEIGFCGFGVCCHEGKSESFVTFSILTRGGHLLLFFDTLGPPSPPTFYFENCQTCRNMERTVQLISMPPSPRCARCSHFDTFTLAFYTHMCMHMHCGLSFLVSCPEPERSCIITCIS